MSFRASAMFPEKRRPSKERASFCNRRPVISFRSARNDPAARRIQKIKCQIQIAQLNHRVLIGRIELHGAAEILARLWQFAQPGVHQARRRYQASGERRSFASARR